MDTDTGNVNGGVILRLIYFIPESLLSPEIKYPSRISDVSLIFSEINKLAGYSHL